MTPTVASREMARRRPERRSLGRGLLLHSKPLRHSAPADTGNRQEGREKRGKKRNNNLDSSHRGLICRLSTLRESKSEREKANRATHACTHSTYLHRQIAAGLFTFPSPQRVRLVVCALYAQVVSSGVGYLYPVPTLACALLCTWPRVCVCLCALRRRVCWVS